VLKEWVRVLKPRGVMILECPNLLSACQELLQNPDVATGPGQEGSARCGFCTATRYGRIR
jgi:predicted SAM-dependent methyltransferase